MRSPADMSDVRHLTIRTFPEGDPRGYFLLSAVEQVRMGESLSFFRTQVGGDEGLITWKDGDSYWVSLKPWEGMDPELTYVHPVFRRPYDRAALEQQIVKPRRAHPRSRSHSPYARMAWGGVFVTNPPARHQGAAGGWPNWAGAGDYGWGVRDNVAVLAARTK